MCVQCSVWGVRAGHLDQVSILVIGLVRVVMGMIISQEADERAREKNGGVVRNFGEDQD